MALRAAVLWARRRVRCAAAPRWVLLPSSCCREAGAEVEDDDPLETGAEVEDEDPLETGAEVEERVPLETGPRSLADDAAGTLLSADDAAGRC
ncbi:unnamed protein product [Tilletia controversa]|nr:hypothetical protein CF328_g9383 [Tilletia controversa]CAD6962311.1 unnamed protein product [Tilletia controversa]